ncbi:MAG: OsmC family protein, partial [Flavobacteriales bacterium]|nr:OsmC family protein [Flavobacteriales bacterium]
APTDNEGRGEAFSPTDLVATALGSCMLTIIGIKARDSGFNLDNITVDITKIMASDPRRIDEIVVAFHFEGRTYSEKEKTIIERAARTCPVALSISTEIKQRISFNW